jgi:ketosteroid isomerase-like protein
MSQENVEVVRLAVDAFNRRDLARLAELSDRDLEIVSVLTAVDAQAATYRGLAGWTRILRGYRRGLEELADRGPSGA